MSPEEAKIDQTIVIEHPPEEVWAYIADARNDPAWWDKVLSGRLAREPA